MGTNRVSADSRQPGVDRSGAIGDRDWQTQRGAPVKELQLAGGSCAGGGNRDSERKVVAGGWLFRGGYGQRGMRSNLRAAATTSSTTTAASTPVSKAQDARQC